MRACAVCSASIEDRIATAKLCANPECRRQWKRQTEQARVLRLFDERMGEPVAQPAPLPSAADQWADFRLRLGLPPVEVGLLTERIEQLERIVGKTAELLGPLAAGSVDQAARIERLEQLGARLAEAVQTMGQMVVTVTQRLGG